MASPDDAIAALYKAIADVVEIQPGSIFNTPVKTWRERLRTIGAIVALLPTATRRLHTIQAVCSRVLRQPLVYTDTEAVFEAKRWVDDEAERLLAAMSAEERAAILSPSLPTPEQQAEFEKWLNQGRES